MYTKTTKTLPSALRPVHLTLGASLLALVAIAGCGAAKSTTSSDELAAVERLRQLGAVASLDLSGKHAYAVSLASSRARANFREAAQLIAKLPELEVLDVSGCPLAEADLDAFSRLEHLAALHLADTNLRDAAAPRLARFTNLRMLNLHGTSVTERTLPELAKLDRLQMLILSDTAVAGDLAAVRQLPCLEVLIAPSPRPDGDGRCNDPAAELS